MIDLLQAAYETTVEVPDSVALTDYEFVIGECRICRTSMFIYDLDMDRCMECDEKVWDIEIALEQSLKFGVSVLAHLGWLEELS